VANAIIRNGLQTPVRLSGTRPALEPKHRRQGLRRVNDHLRGLPEETALLSAEALSFARMPGELHRIAMLCDGMDWRAVMFLREPAAWLASWQTQVSLGLWAKRPDAVMGSGVLDLGPESWLVDHDAIRAFWGNRCAFLDYEDAMAKHGSVIPAFLAEIGLDPGVCPDWGDYYLNSSAVKRAFAAGLR